MNRSDWSHNIYSSKKSRSRSNFTGNQNIKHGIDLESSEDIEEVIIRKGHPKSKKNNNIKITN